MTPAVAVYVALILGTTLTILSHPRPKGRNRWRIEP